jgi:hypothetical protein
VLAWITTVVWRHALSLRRDLGTDVVDKTYHGVHLNEDTFIIPVSEP